MNPALDLSEECDDCGAGPGQECAWGCPINWEDPPRDPAEDMVDGIGSPL